MKRKGKPALVHAVALGLLVMFTSVMAYGATLQEEFEQLCVHTQEAESLSLEKLQELLKECDQLQKTIDESNDAKKKLLLFRLKKCRNFFVYNIELKERGDSSSQQKP